MKALFLSALLALPTTASAEESYFGVWHLSSARVMCTLTVHSTDKAFQLSYTSLGPASVMTDIFSSDPRVLNLPSTRVHLSFIFDDGTESNISGHVTGKLTDGRVGVAVDPDHGMAAIRRSREMKVFMNGELLTTFPLDGGKSAMDAWTECAARSLSN